MDNTYTVETVSFKNNHKNAGGRKILSRMCTKEQTVT